MNVLSLFDGLSCGRIALERAGIKVDNYFASEIDKHAIKVSKANWKDVIHIGDVTKVSYKDGVLYTEVGEFPVKIDMVIGGSPCQGFSMAGSN
jgi:site-specific DNA-cytosine methylase